MPVLSLSKRPANKSVAGSTRSYNKFHQDFSC
jgi:hypothetical protein